MSSLWLDRGVDVGDGSSAGDALPDHADVVVVGAGLTGLTTAVLLATAGVSVVVVEGRYVGAAATGNTTAKVSLLQGTRLSQISAKHPESLVRAYARANSAAMAWLLNFCADHDVSVDREDAYTYAQGSGGISAAKAEYRAARSAGLDVRWHDELQVPFPNSGAVMLRDQAQFDPMAVLDALLAEFRSHGGRLVEHTRVRSVRSRGKNIRVRTNQGEVSAGHVVLATGTPILDRGAFFARVEPLRSYCAAFDVPDNAFPRSMYLSADGPSRSLRYARHHTGEKLIVGGNGHPVGRHESPNRAVADLVDWTQSHFPDAVLTHSWSAQDYESIDALPYAGPLLPGEQRLLVATGFDKWGMTNGVASAIILAHSIIGDEQPAWANAFDSWNVRQLRGLPTAARINTLVGLNMAKGWISPLAHAPDGALPDGQGRVERGFPFPVGRCTDGAVEHKVSAVCPHLGAIVRWNDLERSWDCPLHGSRFAADGAVLEGPATRPLTRVD
ncbi:FAD-dependent oxidoreductase [Antrihabitans sp. YC2-6]|uniref:FAD-dependent oxidoreductase n=1 Tax=Antrihabitans sp. YC2-6 TaxID=2799498 RepID=UPI0018F5B97E|nr:FAD-dependent oxidoreductase [Antrihabitans sp. YC2-6]MBJ8347068.1 FAD-dependent oxidoreductase [Antrihabitans sp. YC2-6]